MPDRPLKVCNVTEEARMGGPQIRIALVAEALHGNVETCVVLPYRDSGPFVRYLSARGVDYAPLPLNRMSRGFLDMTRYLLAWPYEVARLTLLFRRRMPDVVHANGSWQYKGLIAGKLAGRPVVWHLNDTQVPKVIRLAFHWLNRLADGFIFASHRSRAYYGRLIDIDRPAFVIPAPVNTRWFHPECWRAGGRDGGPIVVGTVANVNPTKQLETFVEAAAAVSARHENVQFRIVGHCYESQRPYLDRLRRRQQELGLDNLEFVGSSDDPRTELAAFDVYVCTSRVESSPLSVWEAMSMALPIVSTDVGDVPAFAPDGEVARIVPVGDSAAIAQAVGELLDDPQARQRMGTAARAAAERHLDLRRCAQLHAQAYAAVAGRAAPVPAEADAAAGGQGRST